MDESFRCIHGKPISSPSVRMKCRKCFDEARKETLKTYWRVRYNVTGMVW